MPGVPSRRVSGTRAESRTAEGLLWVATLEVEGDHPGRGITHPTRVRILQHAETAPVGAHQPLSDRKIPAGGGEEENKAGSEVD